MNLQQKFALQIIFYSAIFIGMMIISILEIFYSRRKKLLKYLSKFDYDIIDMSKVELQNEIIKLRSGIRQHRDRNYHELCWHVPELWNLLPERVSHKLNIPETKEFLEQCVVYRKSLGEK